MDSVNNASNELPKFEITNVILYPARAKNNSKVLAYASIVISNIIRIYGIKVINGTNYPYVSWPKYRIGEDKEYRPILFLNSNVKENICKLILKEYNAGNFVKMEA